MPKHRVRATLIQDKDPDTTVENGRERKSGRFATGNQAAVGRARPRSEMREAFERAVTPEDLADIAQALVRRAKRGDVRAAQLILERLCGRPPLVGALHLMGDGDDVSDLIDLELM